MTEIERPREGLEKIAEYCEAEHHIRGGGDVTNSIVNRMLSRVGRDIRAALAAAPPGAERWMPIESAPTNRRIFAYGWHTSADPIYDEEAMVWKDRMDGQFYYAPQGGKLNWTPTHWMPLHDAPAPPSPAAGEK